MTLPAATTPRGWPDAPNSPDEHPLTERGTQMPGALSLAFAFAVGCGTVLLVALVLYSRLMQQQREIRGESPRWDRRALDYVSGAAPARNFHYCANCGELVDEAPRGYVLPWVHVATGAAKCVGVFPPKLAEVRIPPVWVRPVDVDPEPPTAIHPPTVCRNCGRPLEPDPDPSPFAKASPWRHMGGGQPCWRVGIDNVKDLFGLIAEPLRRCHHCELQEYAGDPAVDFISGGPIGEWLCKDIAACNARHNKLYPRDRVDELVDELGPPALDPDPDGVDLAEPLDELDQAELDVHKQWATAALSTKAAIDALKALAAKNGIPTLPGSPQ